MPFDAHAEGEAGDVFIRRGVEVEAEAFFAHSLEHGGVDHAAAQQLDPAGMLAFAAALAAAEDAGDLHVGRRLGEGEKAGEKAGPDVGAEEGAAHALAVTKSRLTRNDIDRMPPFLHHKSRRLDAKVFHGFCRRLARLLVKRAD